MTATNDHDQSPDPIDEEAATIDARSPEAPEQIDELIEHAEEEGRDTDLAPLPPPDEPSAEPS